MELKELKGLGKARLAALENAGIFTLSDLLQTLPRSYRDTLTITPVRDLQPGIPACIQGTLTGKPRSAYFKGLHRVTATLKDNTGSIALIWYNQSWIANLLHENEPILLYGKPDIYKNGKYFLNCPHIESRQGLIPEYAAIPGIPAKTFAALIQQGLSALDTCCKETLPSSIRLKHSLCERNFALRQLHCPDSKESLFMAQRRLAFEELLLYQLTLSSLRGTPGKAHPMQNIDMSFFWNSLRFAPTNAQTRVFSEIEQDLLKDTSMRRMIQGDVGCGKTLIAFAAIYMCVKNGYQCVLLAPTEILARQHLQSALEMLQPLGVSCGLLLGGMKVSEKKDALEAIQNGSWQCVIGTHALLTDSVHFSRLGLVITDEQHRFGVHQRKILMQKSGDSLEPHTLVMSATPIPRSLALILYGDLSLSVVDELPPGRTPVQTRIVPGEKREGMYQFIISEVRKGHQCYIVCPLIEESEMIEATSAQEMYALLCNGPLSSLRVGLTYGSQENTQKEQTISDFQSGKLDILVSTTVIEVGVNVPNATIMVIENANRFGLSQLHQLRGRVGRGSSESWCFLMGEPNERLKALCSTNDGFKIAQKDLEIRGPGELLGTSQSGMGGFVRLAADTKLIYETRQCLNDIQAENHNNILNSLEAAAREKYGKIVEKIVLN